jgi:hypothetical protein
LPSRSKDASNPLRDVKPPRSDDPEPRALPYEIIEGILAAMPERGQIELGAQVKLNWAPGSFCPRGQLRMSY